MASALADRILTIAVTATLTSAFWIVAGGSLLDMAREKSATGDGGAAGASSPPAAGTSQGEQADPLHRGPVAHPDGVGVGNLMIPVAGIAPDDLADTFSDERGSGSRLHEALDIMAPAGTAVVAAAPGTVEKLFQSDAGGKTIYVRSSDRLTIHYYAHLRDYAAGLAEGQKVRQGQQLGTVGSSGNASAEAPHLHFAILRTTADADWWEPATAINPYPLLAKR